MKNNSARKKLIPAAAMLAISAAMLSTATYAWFTMSKEVSVTGINMTATTPAGIQISLGKGQSTGTTLDGTVGNITAPGTGDNDADWSNTVAFSNFYKVGKLTPASSNTGEKIYYTADSTSQGKNLLDNAKFYDATDDTPEMASLVLTSGTVSDSTVGYYVDFPVWFRCSTDESNLNGDNKVELAVSATITGDDGEDLHKATRIAILDDDSETNSVSDKLLMVTGAAYYSADSDSTTHKVTGKTDDEAVSGLTGTDPTWGAVAKIVQSTVNASTSLATEGDAVVELSVDPATAGASYGAATKKIIRVWLEGEDVSCYNANAGQSFTISLKFNEKSQST